MTESHHSVEDVLEEIVAARRTGTDPKELFGGPRDWLDSSIPPAAFVVGNIAGGLSAGIWASVAAEAVVVIVRLLRRETLRHAFSGAFGVLIAVLIAKATGQAKNYFVPGIIINAVYAVAFLLSVAFRKPLVGVIMRLVWERPASWHEHPVVRRAYAEATVGWALTFVVRAVVQETLRRLDHTTLLGIAKIVMGYPVYVAALALTLPYLRRRTASVPLPEEPAEAEPETGGGDAHDDAAEGVPDGLASG